MQEDSRSGWIIYQYSDCPCWTVGFDSRVIQTRKNPLRMYLESGDPPNQTSPFHRMLKKTRIGKNRRNSGIKEIHRQFQWMLNLFYGLLLNGVWQGWWPLKGGAWVLLFFGLWWMDKSSAIAGTPFPGLVWSGSGAKKLFRTGDCPQSELASGLACGSMGKEEGRKFCPGLQRPAGLPVKSR